MTTTPTGLAIEANGLVTRYAFDGLRHRVGLKSLQIAGGEYSGEATLLAVQPMTLDAKPVRSVTPSFSAVTISSCSIFSPSR